MVKLVVSDLDGTLLKPGLEPAEQRLPAATFEIIEKLHKKGIIFAPATGRQLPNVKRLFAPVLDKIAIIAENGGLCWHGGEIIFADPTPDEGVNFALSQIKDEKGLYPLLSCTDCAYYQSGNPEFVKTVHRSYSSAERVENLNGVIGKHTVIKISVWDERPPCANHGGIIIPPKVKGLRAMVSGYDWLDISAPDANKGKALKALAARLKVEKAQIMAFGDHMNDYEMLAASGEAYVTANAFFKLKELIPREVQSNAEEGVINKIRELL